MPSGITDVEMKSLYADNGMIESWSIESLLAMRRGNAWTNLANEEANFMVSRSRALRNVFQQVRPGFGDKTDLTFIEDMWHARGFEDPGGEGYRLHERDEAVKGVLRQAASFYPSEWIQDSNDRGEIIAGATETFDDGAGNLVESRANHTFNVDSSWTEDPDSFAFGDSAIYTPPDDVSTATHELAHRLQTIRPTIGGLENEFFMRRLQESDSEPISVRNEIHYPDGFPESYSGRVYKHDDGYGKFVRRFATDSSTPNPIVKEHPKHIAREILPVGMQYVWFPGKDDIFETDPEYADFVLGLLARA